MAQSSGLPPLGGFSFHSISVMEVHDGRGDTRPAAHTVRVLTESCPQVSSQELFLANDGRIEAISLALPFVFFGQPL